MRIAVLLAALLALAGCSEPAALDPRAVTAAQRYAALADEVNIPTNGTAACEDIRSAVSAMYAAYLGAPDDADALDSYHRAAAEALETCSTMGRPNASATRPSPPAGSRSGGAATAW